MSELAAAFGLRLSLSEVHADGHLDPLTVDPAALGREQRGGHYPVQNKKGLHFAGPSVLVTRQISGSIIIVIVPMPSARTSADVARSYVDVAADVRPFLRVGADGPGFGDRERGRDS